VWGVRNVCPRTMTASQLLDKLWDLE